MRRSGRDELWRRLLEAHAAAKDARDRSTEAAQARDALIDALVRDGTSYTDLGRALGVSRQRAFRMHQKYEQAVSEDPTLADELSTGLSTGS